MAQRTKIQLPGAETIRAHVPMQRKGQPWTMELRPVSYFPDLGETPADAEAFASTIAESLRRMDAAETERRNLPAAEPMTPCAEGGKRCYFGSDKSGVHVGHGPSAEHWDDADYAALMAQAAGFRPVAAPVTRKPRKAAPVIQDRTYAEAVAAVPDAMTLCNGCELRPMVAPEHPGYAAGLCAECYADAIAGTIEPDPAPTDVVQVRVNDVTIATTRRIDISAPEPETTESGHCRPCESGSRHADGRLTHGIAPETAPTAELDAMTAYLHAQAAETAARQALLVREIAAREHAPQWAVDEMAHTAEPEPVAPPVLTVVPSRSRPTCERCGQTFRVSGTGYAWHVANRPDCASKRLAVVA